MSLAVPALSAHFQSHLMKPVQPGTTEEVFPMESGELSLRRPERMTPDEYEDAASGLEIVLRKMKRSVVDDQAPPPSPEPEDDDHE